MFVRRSVHRKLELDYLETIAAYKELIEKWNTLVRKINRKGGAEFLESKDNKTPPPIDINNINKLIFLCHPDKHGNSEKASEMTKLLLELRKIYK